jgi:hypothetical protein
LLPERRDKNVIHDWFGGAAGSVAATGQAATPATATARRINGPVHVGFMGRPVVQPASAKPAEVGRYQISSWALGYGHSKALGESQRGAYVLDTQTGEVYLVEGDKKPVAIGKAGGK